MSRPAVMYRLWNEAGDLLYVGCTVNLDQRVQDHAKKEWGSDIAAVDAVIFKTRPEAAAAEFNALCEEAPRHNVLKTPDRLDTPCLFADAVALIESSTKATLASVGDALGITGERVRQILRDGGYDYPALATERRLVWRDFREAQKSVRERVRRERLPLCSVCGVEHCSSRKAKTCGPKCAEARRQLRTTTDEYRIVQARSILRRADRVPAARVEWAKRMLSDTPPPPNRHYSKPGSKRHAVLSEIGAA